MPVKPWPKDVNRIRISLNNANGGRLRITMPPQLGEKFISNKFIELYVSFANKLVIDFSGQSVGKPYAIIKTKNNWYFASVISEIKGLEKLKKIKPQAPREIDVAVDVGKQQLVTHFTIDEIVDDFINKPDRSNQGNLFPKQPTTIPKINKPIDPFVSIEEETKILKTWIGELIQKGQKVNIAISIEPLNNDFGETTDITIKLIKKI